MRLNPESAGFWSVLGQIVRLNPESAGFWSVLGQIVPVPTLHQLAGTGGEGAPWDILDVVFGP